MVPELVTLERAEVLAPRQLLTGPGSSHAIGAALRTWGVPVGVVLVVADRVVAAAGLIDSVLEGLNEAGFRTVVQAEVAGEPTSEVVDRAAAVARTHEVVAVVGVGGGSAMDAAKMAALLCTNDGTTADWLGSVTPSQSVAPLALVPTTTGTGSEATRISMVTVDGVKRVVSCPQLVPLVAALDDDLVADLPAAVVASTGMDALAHAVESMLSTNRSTYTLTRSYVPCDA